MLADRKKQLSELAEKIGISLVSLSNIKTGKIVINKNKRSSLLYLILGGIETTFIIQNPTIFCMSRDNMLRFKKQYFALATHMQAQGFLILLMEKLYAPLKQWLDSTSGGLKNGQRNST